MDRRKFIKSAGFVLPVAGLLPQVTTALIPSAHSPDDTYIQKQADQQEAADYTIHIGTGLIEVGPQHIISTITYNGQFPGPLLRFKEGQRTVVDIYNDTDRPEQFHWHGQFVPVDMDGSAEEGTPYILPHGMRREIFIPKPAGFRFYHSHVVAGADLSAGQYSGQVGPVYIEPAIPKTQYREEFIVMKEFDPYFMRGGDMAMDFLAGKAIPELKAVQEKAEKMAPETPKGFEVGYKIFTINGRQMGHGKPIDVQYGESVLFHILNGSATETRSMSLPGHKFKVIAMDGNPVPHPTEVPVLWLGTAERISAVVEMKTPGVWIMGDLADDDRGNGMGIVIRYKNHKGKPQWIKPKPFIWDYTIFGNHQMKSAEPDEIIKMTFAKQQAAEKGFNRWTINGVAFDMMSMKPMFRIKEGKR